VVPCATSGSACYRSAMQGLPRIYVVRINPAICGWVRCRRCHWSRSDPGSANICCRCQHPHGVHTVVGFGCCRSECIGCGKARRWNRTGIAHEGKSFVVGPIGRECRARSTIVLLTNG
jgi:hypothetical protein